MGIRCHPSSCNDISSNASSPKFLSNVVFRKNVDVDYRVQYQKISEQISVPGSVVMGGDLIVTKLTDAE